MPRKIDPNFVPIWVRPICYQCGVTFQNDNEKTNCRMCYDVFCVSCVSPNLLMLPPNYGWSDPQKVCSTCDTLVHAFPMFASQLHGGHGGQLLDRRHRVITVVGAPPEGEGGVSNSSVSSSGGGGSSKRPPSPTSNTLVANNSSFGSKKSIPASAQTKGGEPEQKGGFISSVKNFFGGKKEEENTGPARNSKRQSTSVLAATPKGKKALRAERATQLELHSWRPLGMETCLVCGDGETRVYLKEIKTVEFKDHVVVNLMDGRRVEFIVVQSEGDVAEDQFKEGSSFIVDASANFSLASGLASLVKICKTHFALTSISASMALHKDVQEKAATKRQSSSTSFSTQPGNRGSGGSSSGRVSPVTEKDKAGIAKSSLLASVPLD